MGDRNKVLLHVYMIHGVFASARAVDRLTCLPLMTLFKPFGVVVALLLCPTFIRPASAGMRTHTAEETAEKKMMGQKTAATQAAAAVPAAAAPATPPPPTTQQVLHPDIPPAFEDATKAMAQYKIPDGLKMSVFAAEPQLQNPVQFSIDNKGKFWVCETFRFDGGGQGMGVYDIRQMYDRLDTDLASKTVEQRMAALNLWNKGDQTAYTNGRIV